MAGLENFLDQTPGTVDDSQIDGVDPRGRSRFEINKKILGLDSQSARNALETEVNGVTGGTVPGVNGETVLGVTGVPSQIVDENKTDPSPGINTGAEVLEGFSPENMNFCEGVLDENSDQILSKLTSLNTEIERAGELSQEELITAHQSIKITGGFLSDGVTIKSEVSRIISLPPSQEITLNEGGDGDKTIFETKKDALLFLYYKKLTLKRSQECLDSISTENMNKEEKTCWLKYGLYILGGYMIYNTFTTGIKKFNFALLSRGILSKRTSGQEMNSSGLGTEGNEGVLSGELTRRREAAELLDYVTQGNERFGSKNLPNKLILDNKLKNAAKENLGGRYTESIYWRELFHQSQHHGNLSGARIFNTTMKLWNSRISDNTIKYLQSQAEIKNTVLRQLFNTTGTSQGTTASFTKVQISPGTEGILIRNFRAFMDLSHEVGNTDEVQKRAEVDRIIRQIETGDLDFISKAKDAKAALQEIQQRLLEATNGSRVDDDELARIFGDKTATNNGEGAKLLAMEVKPSMLDITKYDESIAARKVRAELDGKLYDKRAVRTHLQDFFDSVGTGPGEHRYNYKTASLIIAKILSGETKQEAIDKSFATSKEQLDLIVIDRSYISTQNNILISKLEIDLTTKAGDIGSIQELKEFDKNIMNLLVGSDGAPNNLFGTAIVRALNLILQEKITAGLPDTRPTPIPETTGDGDDRARETLRGQKIFDANGTINNDARTILDGNVTVFVLNGGELENRQIEDALAEYKNKNLTVGDMIEDLKGLNSMNIISDIEGAQRVIQESQIFEIQDLVERALLMNGSYLPDTSVDIKLSEDRSSVLIDIKDGASIRDSIEGNIGDDSIQSKLKTLFDLSGDIVDWSELNINPVYSHSIGRITDNRTEKLGFLRIIDRLLRKAK